MRRNTLLEMLQEVKQLQNLR